ISLTSGALHALTRGETIAGPGPANLTINANDLFAVFAVAGTAPVTISGLTITAGQTAAPRRGVLNMGVLPLSNVTLFDNIASSGGGVANLGATARLTVTHSAILGNLAATNGGGLANGTGAIATITGSLIATNSGGTNGGGAGIYNQGTLTVNTSSVSDNTGSGAIFFGGGIENATGGSLTLTASTVSGNMSQGAGGGIRSGGTAVAIINSTIVNNAAMASTGGGGIRVSGGTLAVHDSTITDNTDDS